MKYPFDPEFTKACFRALVEVPSPVGYYPKMEPVFEKAGALRYGNFGDAHCALCSARKMAEITKKCLERNQRLFRGWDAPEYE